MQSHLVTTRVKTDSSKFSLFPKLQHSRQGSPSFATAESHASHTTPTTCLLPTSSTFQFHNTTTTASRKKPTPPPSANGKFSHTSNQVWRKTQVFVHSAPNNAPPFSNMGATTDFSAIILQQVLFVFYQNDHPLCLLVSKVYHMYRSLLDEQSYRRQLSSEKASE